MIIKLAQDKEDLYGILSVQSQNLKDKLPKNNSYQHGFVTVRHTYEMLEKMNVRAKHIIAKSNDEIVAYALVMLKEFKDLIPVLAPMFDTFEKVNYQGKRLSDLDYYVMGQICVRDDYKRQGLFQKLYLKHKEVYSKYYDYCLTEISTSNVPSLMAHKKLGFKTIHTYTDNLDEWHIVMWNWELPTSE